MDAHNSTSPPHDADTDTESPSSPSLSPSRHSHSSRRSLDLHPSSSPPSPSSSPSPVMASDDDDGGLMPAPGHMDAELLPGTGHLSLPPRNAHPLPALVAPAHPSTVAPSIAGPVGAGGAAAAAIFHFDWVIDDFVALRKAHVERHYSPNFVLDGYTWRLLLFPNGNSAVFQPNHRDVIALYVQWVSDRSPAPQQPHRFVLELVPPPPTAGREPVPPHRKDSQHVFTVTENDRGFNPFIGLKELPSFLHPPQQSLHIRVELERMRFAPSSAYNYLDATYDSKAMTGFVGLRNQGATCYMNSLLQTLYHLPLFRHLLYSLPTSSDTGTSVPLSLQRVFYQLQTSNHAVSTKLLTQAFGWNSSESWQQHDVQEFSRVLLDNISERVKKTEMEGKADALFAGKSQMYIQCVNVPFKSERIETYLDLAMNVKGCRGLVESFDQYVEVELLEKENAYRAEQYGLQDARKGSRFLTFPPILQLQLKRFEYNFERDMNVKVNDRFEFPTLLDLTPYLATTTPIDPSDPPLYHLHSVLVHSGSGHGGHYFSYIRPFFDGVPYEHGSWYKFDDETVVRATEEEATVGCYGGVPERAGGGMGYFPMGRMSLASSANAYMLVYIRQSVAKMTMDDIRRDVALSGQQKAAVETNGVKREEKKAELPIEQPMTASAAAPDAEEKKMEVDPTTDQRQPTTTTISPPSLTTTTLNNNTTDDVKMSDPTTTTPQPPTADMQTEPPAPAAITVPLPDALLSRFQREEKDLQERQAAARRAALFTEVQVVSEQQLIDMSDKTGSGTELTVGKEEGEEFMYDTPNKVVKVLKTSSLRDALARQPESAEEDWQLAAGIPLPYQQFWRITPRTNETERPNSYFPVHTHADNNHNNTAAQQQLNQSVNDFKQKPLYVRTTQYDSLYPQYSGGQRLTEHDLENASKQTGDGGDKCLVLVKWFDVDKQMLRWVGSLIVSKRMLMSEVKRYVWKVMQRRGLWRDKHDSDATAAQRVKMDVEGKEGAVQQAQTEQAEGEQRQKVQSETAHKVHEEQADGEDGREEEAVPDILGWEEENVANDRITYLSDSQTVKEALLRNGDLLCFQHRYTDQEVQQLRARHTMSHSQQHTMPALPPTVPSPAALPPASLTTAFFSEVPHYLRYLNNRVSIEFRLIPYTPPTKDKPSPPNTAFRIELSKQHSYHDVMLALSAHTSVEPGRLSLHRPSLINKQQADYLALDKTLHMPDGPGLLGRLVEQMGGDGLLYYQVLEFDPALLMEHYALNVCYVSKKVREERVRLLVRKKATFGEASAVVRHKLRQIRHERREKEERDRQASDAAAQQPPASGGDEMKEDSNGAAPRAASTAAATTSYPLDELDESLARPEAPPMHFFCLVVTLHEREFKMFNEHATMLYEFESFYRHKHAELVMEEKTDQQIAADTASAEHRARVMEERSARAQLVGGVPDSSDDDSDEDDMEGGAVPHRRLVDPAAPITALVFRFVPQTGPVNYRLYSHPFTILFSPRTTTVRQLHALLDERLGAVEHAPLRLGLLREKEWIELKADDSCEERDWTLAECTQRFQTLTYAVYDSVDARADKARLSAVGTGGVMSPYGQFGGGGVRNYGLWRGNNAAVKIYQQ